MTKRQAISLLILTILFFIIGQFEYENLYRLTLYTVKALSNVPLSFFGKFPFWFGDIRFSFIIAGIPLAAFLPGMILGKTRHATAISVSVYCFYFICSYLLVCFGTGLGFHSYNDFYHGEVIAKNLTEININETFLTTILLATIATSLTFLLAKLIRWARFRKSNPRIE